MRIIDRYKDENYLFDIDDIVEISIQRIIDAYRMSQNLGLGRLFVTFSGGKDSVCVYFLCKMASERLGMASMDELGEYVYNVTTIDPPELVHFIKTFKNVQRIRPEKNFFRLIIEKGMPPLRQKRFCCAELKERGGVGRFCLTGVRWAESIRRRNTRGSLEILGKTSKENKILNADNDDDRRLLEQCVLKRKFICNPIVDWGDGDVWRFLAKYDLPYCTLYDEGWKRIGCLNCPMASKRERERDGKVSRVQKTVFENLCTYA